MFRSHPLLHRWLTAGLFAFLITQARADIGPPAHRIPPLLIPDREQVERFQRIEFDIVASTDYRNPFDPDEVSLNLELTAPNGKEIVVPAFCYQPFERRILPDDDRMATWLYPIGPLRWRARFAPEATGLYEARAVLTDRNGTTRSGAVAFESIPSRRRGFLRVSQADPRFFATSDGTAFFPIGQNLAFIGETQFLNLVRAGQTLERLADHGANYVRIWAGCHDWAMGVEARKSAFGRSWNWHPPFAPHPDDPERLSVRLAGEAGSSIRIDPSHRVALRPDTRYRLHGRVRTDNGAALVAAVGNRRSIEPATGPKGHWVGWQLDFTTGPREHWLPETTLRLAQEGTAWIDSLSLQEIGGGPELLWEADPNRPARGVYNQPDCQWLDEVIEAAEKHGVLIQLTLFTRDLYMNDLADDSSPAYDKAIDDARKLLRYAVARWGASTSLAVWEYFNEMDPRRPTTRFYRELAAFLDRIDPYRHLRSTSTWHPSPRDWQLPWLDFADEHFYLRPGDYERLRDEVDAVLERVDLLRQHAPNRPVLLGEFGLANERWQPTREMRERPDIVDFHNAIWASALSGASGTALFWWWDRLDPRNHYPHYRPLAAFLKEIPWTNTPLHPVHASVQFPPTPDVLPRNANDKAVVVVGLAGRDQAHLWLFHTQASWNRTVVKGEIPDTLKGASLVVPGLADGSYQVHWWDTRQGGVIATMDATSEQGELRVATPEFDRDIACRIVTSFEQPSTRAR